MQRPPASQPFGESSHAPEAASAREGTCRGAPAGHRGNSAPDDPPMAQSGVETDPAEEARRRGPAPTTRPSATPVPDLRVLARLRAERPEAVAEAAAGRERRPLLPAPGARLMIVAADHPARGALAAGDRQFAMADRADLLARLCLALSRPGVDGVLASADVLDDLLLLGALNGKIVIGSMNRGGLAGASFELDDRFTGYAPGDIHRLGFDAGKLLLRIDYDDPGEGSVRTLEAAARAVDAMAAHRLPVFVEPFLSRRDPESGLLRNDLSPEAVVRSIAIASGLGGTSAYTWLKLPVTDDPDAMARVMETSTLPAVLLGGDVKDGDQDAAYEKWRAALELPTVQGLVVGRSLLYPADGDVAQAVDTAVGLL
ncbi:deoxyribose-phosphate aldolase [Streptomyces sp. NPDC102467]|uniref:Cgl0159 family (beta/alpha)8-fold protein n=1 Tax=Streptomyces sp. NPDC102467 TaxID=3366179 RepID=UPI003809D2BD